MASRKAEAKARLADCRMERCRTVAEAKALQEANEDRFRTALSAGGVP